MASVRSPANCWSDARRLFLSVAWQWGFQVVDRAWGLGRFTFRRETGVCLVIFRFGDFSSTFQCVKPPHPETFTALKALDQFRNIKSFQLSFIIHRDIHHFDRCMFILVDKLVSCILN